MTNGIRINNKNTGELVVADDGIGYHWYATPAVYQTIPSGANETGYYVFRVTMPATNMPPIAFVRVTSGAVVEVSDVYLDATDSTGKTWLISVYSVSYGTAYTTPTMVTPTIDVFAPALTPAEPWGCVLWRKPDGKIAADFTRRALFPREMPALPARGGDYAYVLGDSVTLDVSVTTPAVMGGTNAYHFEADTLVGRFYNYGWRLNGSNLERRLYLRNTDSSMGQDDGQVSELAIYSTRAVVIEAAGL